MLQIHQIRSLWCSPEHSSRVRRSIHETFFGRRHTNRDRILTDLNCRDRKTNGNFETPVQRSEVSAVQRPRDRPSADENTETITQETWVGEAACWCGGMAAIHGFGPRMMLTGVY
jgi:hypothetical protein